MIYILVIVILVITVMVIDRLRAVEERPQVSSTLIFETRHRQSRDNILNSKDPFVIQELWQIERRPEGYRYYSNKSDEDSTLKSQFIIARYSRYGLLDALK